MRALNRAQQDIGDQVAAQDKKKVNAHPSCLANNAEPPEPAFCRGPMVKEDRNDRERTQPIQFHYTF